MKHLVTIVFLFTAAACSPDEKGDLVHSSPKERHTVHQETIKTDREALETIGIDTTKRVSVKEIMQKARESAKTKGE